MRTKLHRLFGFKLADDESITAYLDRMDKIGQLDLKKIIGIISMMMDEIENIELKKEEKPPYATTGGGAPAR